MKWGSNKQANHMKMISVCVYGILSCTESARTFDRYNPFAIKVVAVHTKARRKDGLYWFLGNSVIGPFFRNLVIPKEAEHMLKMKVIKNFMSPKETTPQFSFLQVLISNWRPSDTL